MDVSSKDGQLVFRAAGSSVQFQGYRQVYVEDEGEQAAVGGQQGAAGTAGVSGCEDGAGEADEAPMSTPDVAAVLSQLQVRTGGHPRSVT